MFCLEALVKHSEVTYIFKMWFSFYDHSGKIVHVASFKGSNPHFVEEKKKLFACFKISASPHLVIRIDNHNLAPIHIFHFCQAFLKMYLILIAHKESKPLSKIQH